MKYKRKAIGEATRVKTLRSLQTAALNRKSVFSGGSGMFEKPCPAAFVINLPGTVLCRLLHGSGLYLYDARTME